MSNIEKWLDEHLDEMISATSKLIQIKSVQTAPVPGKPFGEGAYEALEFTKVLSESLGLEAVMMDGYAVHASYGPKDAHIGVLTHVDVVPEGNGWQHDPYGGEVVEGKIFGRGAIDDKGPLVASIFALAAIKNAAPELEKGIRLLFGSDEETGMVSIEHYLSKEKPFEAGFTPDARFPVIHGEKGWLNLSLHMTDPFNQGANSPFDVTASAVTTDLKLLSLTGGVAANVVADRCEAILIGSAAALSSAYDQLIYFVNASGAHLSVVQQKNTLEIISYGKAAHASRPEKGKSAISVMFAALGHVLPKSNPVGRFMAYYQSNVGLGYNGEGCGCAFEDKASGKLTFNIGTARYELGELSLKIDVRYPVTYTADQVAEGVSSAFETFDAVVSLLDFEPPLYYELDHHLIQTLSSCYQQVSGDYVNRPFVVGGLTYARTMPNIVAYGPLSPDAPDVAHQKDEYIEVGTLLEASKIYARAMLKLAGKGEVL